MYPGKSLSTGIDLQTAGSLKRKHFVNSSNINVSEYQSTNTDVVTQNGESPKRRLNLDEPFYEYSEIGWEGKAEELAIFILIGGCQCSGLDE